MFTFRRVCFLNLFDLGSIYALRDPFIESSVFEALGDAKIANQLDCSIAKGFPIFLDLEYAERQTKKFRQDAIDAGMMPYPFQH